MSKTKEIVVKIFNRFDRPKIDGIKCPTPGLTQQQFKDECNINYIVENYTKTGQWNSSGESPTQQPMFGDFTSAPDFVEAQNLLAEASQMFDALPAKIRKRFNNDPTQLLEFVADEKNIEEAYSLGIATRKAEQEPPKEGNPVSAQ